MGGDFGFLPFPKTDDELKNGASKKYFQQAQQILSPVKDYNTHRSVVDKKKNQNGNLHAELFLPCHLTARTPTVFTLNRY